MGTVTQLVRQHVSADRDRRLNWIVQERSYPMKLEC